MRDRRDSSSSIRPSAKLRYACVRLDQQLGCTAASRELGLTRESFARIMAGLGVRAGTIALAEKRLAEYDSAAKAKTPKSSAA